MNPVLSITPLGFPWVTFDPFLFCVHHDDRYPRATSRWGPAASLAGRDLGQDFAGPGWLAHVPRGGRARDSPQHPHRGFETVTGAARADRPLGFAGCGGPLWRGDVQWLTAGKGVVHAEMFPLLDTGGANPLELFQIWLNLPARNKIVEPHFTMFWAEDVPHRRITDSTGANTEVVCVAGWLDDGSSVRPPPAAGFVGCGRGQRCRDMDRDHGAGARWTLPPARG